MYNVYLEGQLYYIASWCFWKNLDFEISLLLGNNMKTVKSVDLTKLLFFI